MCGVVFRRPYIYMRDVIFMRRANQYRLIKNGNSYTINAHKGKLHISLVSTNQDKKLVSSTKKYVLLFLRENQFDDESIRVNAYLEGCTKEKKHWLEDFLHAYRGVFQEPKWIPPKREVDHRIQLFPYFPLLNIGFYRQSILEENEVKKKLQHLLEQGVIRPRTSPCGSPINIVSNKDETWQLCIDYRHTNNITLKSWYILPRY
jgi:hypothetical protein